MLTTVEHRSDLTRDRGQLLLDELAEVAVKSEIDPGAWIPRFTRQSTLDDRVAWAERVADLLHELPTERPCTAVCQTYEQRTVIVSMLRNLRGSE